MLQGKEERKRNCLTPGFQEKVRMRMETASPELARLWRWLPFFTFPHGRMWLYDDFACSLAEGV